MSGAVSRMHPALSDFQQDDPACIVQSRMKRALLGLWLITGSFFAADAVPWKWQSGLVPDAGFDLDQAKVVRVTSLESKGKGTLRAALSETGPRLIVFEIGGVIDLDMKGLEIEAPQCFIAGQTAPAPGITVIRGSVQLAADQIVIQHLAVRPGDAGQPKKSGWQPDSISTTGGPVDVWVDHCSTTWSIDENLSASTYKPPTGKPAARIHFRDCIVAEALNNASHEKGSHSKGSLVYGGTQEVAIVNCLYSSQVERNPVFQAGTSGVIVNNVIANPGERAIHAHAANEDKAPNAPNARIAVVNNVVLFGQHTKKAAGVFEGVADGYFKGNEGFNWEGAPIPELRVPFATLPKPPVWPEGLEATSTSAAMWHVARFVGARPAQRDPIDQRIVNAALTGTAKIIDSQEEVGDYPKYEPVTRPLVVPDAGRRAWLEKLAREVTLGTKE